VKSLIAQEWASLNESQLENSSLHNKLDGFKRISSPIKVKARGAGLVCNNINSGVALSSLKPDLVHKEIHNLQKQFQSLSSRLDSMLPGKKEESAQVKRVPSQNRKPRHTDKKDKKVR
jgi:hypothetical protein